MRHSKNIFVTLKTGPAALALCLLLLASGCAQEQPSDLTPIRRVITAEDEQGKAHVLADGLSLNVVPLNGSTITRIWETTQMPVPLNIESDIGATAGNAYREGFTGSSLYIADIPPGSSLEEIPLHKQDSLDYIAILSGQINLELKDQMIPLQTGDILVQAGNLHSWTNTSSVPCRMLVVVLTGKR